MLCATHMPRRCGRPECESSPSSDDLVTPHQNPPGFTRVFQTQSLSPNIGEHWASAVIRHQPIGTRFDQKLSPIGKSRIHDAQALWRD